MSETAVAASRTADQSSTPIGAGLQAAGGAVPVALLASLPGLVFAAGFDHLAYGLGLLAGVVLAGLVIAPQVVRTGGTSITQALDRTFGRATANVAALVIVLVVLPLLAVEFSFIAIVADGFGVSSIAAVAIALMIAAATAAFVGERAFAWLQAAAFAFLALVLFVPLAGLALKAHGVAVPHIGYGETLSAVAALEEKLLENGLVDFDTFGAHVTPFLRLSQLGFFALVVALALGTAVLLPLVSSLTASRSAAAARLAGAWAALFLMLILVAVPALAALAKQEIYGAMTAGTPLASLPSWLEAPLHAGLARIHGTSVYLLEAVAEAQRAAHGDVASLADALSFDERAYTQWTALGADTQAAVFAAAQALVADPQAAAWDVYVKTLLPAAAAGAGNEAATLTQAALAIEPAGLLLALPGVFGAPRWLAVAMAIAGLSAALVMAAALVRSLFAWGGAGEPGRVGGSLRALALGLIPAALAAAIATLHVDDLVSVVVASLSLGAAGLFPVLAAGLAWKRATAAGAIAAIAVGAGVTLYYDVGIQAFPVSFYNTWAPLSNAGEFAIENFRATDLDAQDAEDPAVKAQAVASLETLARGTPGRPGLANWFGIDSASGAIFGVPLGFLALVLVSVLTRKRSGNQP